MGWPASWRPAGVAVCGGGGDGGGGSCEGSDDGSDGGGGSTRTAKHLRQGWSSQPVRASAARLPRVSFISRGCRRAPLPPPSLTPATPANEHAAATATVTPPPPLSSTFLTTRKHPWSGVFPRHCSPRLHPRWFKYSRKRTARNNGPCAPPTPSLLPVCSYPPHCHLRKAAFCPPHPLVRVPSRTLGRIGSPRGARRQRHFQTTLPHSGRDPICLSRATHPALPNPPAPPPALPFLYHHRRRQNGGGSTWRPAKGPHGGRVVADGGTTTLLERPTQFPARRGRAGGAGVEGGSGSSPVVLWACCRHVSVAAARTGEGCPAAAPPCGGAHGVPWVAASLQTTEPRVGGLQHEQQRSAGEGEGRRDHGGAARRPCAHARAPPLVGIPCPSGL